MTHSPAKVETNVVFVFADEGANSTVVPPLSSFTGLVVEPGQYDELRWGVYRVLGEEIQPQPTEVAIPPELHWREFLPDSSDERKIEVLTDLVELVLEVGVSVVRVGYFVTGPMRQAFGGAMDSNLFGLCWFGLRDALTPLTVDRLVVPVLDAGFSESFQRTVRSYAGSQQLLS